MKLTKVQKQQIEEASKTVTAITSARKAATKELRDATGLQKEPLAQEILKYAEKRMEKQRKEWEKQRRQAEKKRRGARSYKELDEMITREKELSEYLRENFPYREAEGRWCDPDNTIRVELSKNKTGGRGWSEKSYSRNQKWGGVESHYRFYVKPSQELQVIGGLVTIFEKSDAEKTVKPVIWFEQSRGFELKQKSGWLVGGYHSEAKTKEDAIRGAKAHRRYMLKDDDAVLTPAMVHKKFGFCEAGIRNFMKVNEIEKERITLGELKEIVQKNSDVNCRSYRHHLAKMGIALNCK